LKKKGKKVQKKGKGAHLSQRKGKDLQPSCLEGGGGVTKKKKSSGGVRKDLFRESSDLGGGALVAGKNQERKGCTSLARPRRKGHRKKKKK